MDRTIRNFKKRNSEAITNVLGENYCGVSISDFLQAYNKVPGQKQKCLVHLQRDLKETALRNSSSEFHYFKSRLKRIISMAINFGKRESDLCERAIAKCRFEKFILNLCSKRWRDRDCARLSKRLLKHRRSLFTFLTCPEINPNTNAVERALRPIVIVRKITYGNRSNNGADVTKITSSIIQTCSLNGQDFLSWGKEYLEQKLLGTAFR